MNEWQTEKLQAEWELDEIETPTSWPNPFGPIDEFIEDTQHAREWAANNPGRINL